MKHTHHVNRGQDQGTVVNPGPGSVRGGRHVTFDIDGNVCPLQRVQHAVLPFPKAEAGRVHLSSSNPLACAAFQKSTCPRLIPRDQVTHHQP